MLIDAHIHIFPDDMVQNREKYFAGEPEFKMLYDNPKAKLATLADALQMLEQEELERAVACGFPWRKAANFKQHNDCLAAARARHPRKLAALGAFHTDSPQALPEAQRCLEIGLNGLGELAFYQEPLTSGKLAILEPIMQLYAKADLPVMLHANEPIGHWYPGKASADISSYYNFCKKFAKNKIILAHWGGGLIFYLLLKHEVRETLQNVWFDTAALPFLYEDKIYDLCEGFLDYQRILFGSDFPLLKPSRYFSAIKKSSLSVLAREAILGRNAKNLFNFQTL